MSLINTIRFINVNYNNDNIRINDEYLYFNGRSTLISLENGGGKSVMIQMIMAPFVQKSKRDLVDRKFSSYFLTGNPSFILVEWNLDGSIDEKVLTGMMVRRNQHINEKNENELEIINFVAEYNKQCEIDIFHLPVISKQDNQVILKSFSECLDLFEKYKKNREFKFNFFDMSSPNQSSNYFNKLKEFGINYKEWHEIIREVNKEEGGLSKIFSECKDERRLIEKWILPKIEAKLNKENNIISDLQDSLESFLIQRHKIDISIIQKDAIVQFKTDSNTILENATIVLDEENKLTQSLNYIKASILTVHNVQNEINEKITNIQNKLDEIETNIKYVEYEQSSVEYYNQYDKLVKLEEKITQNIKNIEDVNTLYNESNKIIGIFNCLSLKKQIDDNLFNLNLLKTEQEIAQNKLTASNAEIAKLGSSLKKYYLTVIEGQEKKLADTTSEINDLDKKIDENAQEYQQNQEKIQSISEKLGALQTSLSDYEKNEDAYCARYQVIFSTSLFELKYAYSPTLFADHAKQLAQDYAALEVNLQNLRTQLDNLSRAQRETERSVADKNKILLNASLEQRELADNLAKMEEALSVRSNILQYLDLPATDIFASTTILNRLETKIVDLEAKVSTLSERKQQLKKTLTQLTQGFVELSPDLTQLFNDQDIPITYGLEWLKRQPQELATKEELVQQHPFLPYALIVEANDLSKLLQADPVPTSLPIPLITREALSQTPEAQDHAMHQDVTFYMHFDPIILDPKLYAEELNRLQNQLRKIDEEQKTKRDEIEQFRSYVLIIKQQNLTQESFSAAKDNLAKCESEIAILNESLLQLEAYQKELKTEALATHAAIEQEVLNRQALTQQQEHFATLQQQYARYLVAKQQRTECETGISTIKQKNLALNQNTQELKAKRGFAQAKQAELGQKITTLKIEKYKPYASYADIFDLAPDFDPVSFEAKLAACLKQVSQELTTNIDRLNRELQRYQERYTELRQQLASYAASFGFAPSDYETIQITQAEFEEAKDACEKLTLRLQSLNEAKVDLNKTFGSLQTKVETALEVIKNRCLKDDPLPRNQIQEKNFPAELANYKALQQKQLANLDDLKKLLRDLTNTSQMFNNYYDATYKVSDITLPDYFNLETMNHKRIVDFLKANEEALHKSRDTVNELRHNLLNTINNIYNNKIYEPISKILPNLQPIAEYPAKILRELPIKLKIFDDMLSKMEKDITKIEDEKNILIDLIFDYIEKVHKQISLIDHNSSIKIRDQNKKTLRIEIANWENNNTLYKNKIRDFIDTITTECLTILNNGDDIHDKVALNLTTRNLYDQIIGISSIKIHLIKVESQREVVIPWHSVTTNSGGEGFLSAFIVLTSLLSYMRHDENDHLLSGRKEGKILIMDNPFGKTNAAHLLKPLMELAKKNNLQLICLTGLGGDSIYDRFDNIYILNLVPSSLNGVNYLKSTLHKGTAPSVLSLAQFEVLDNRLLDDMKDLFDIDITTEI